MTNTGEAECGSDVMVSLGESRIWMESTSGYGAASGTWAPMPNDMEKPSGMSPTRLASVNGLSASPTCLLVSISGASSRESRAATPISRRSLASKLCCQGRSRTEVFLTQRDICRVGSDSICRWFAGRRHPRRTFHDPILHGGVGNRRPRSQHHLSPHVGSHSPTSPVTEFGPYAGDRSGWLDRVLPITAVRADHAPDRRERRRSSACL